MNKILKKLLYEAIMKNVSKVVKRKLNESIYNKPYNSILDFFKYLTIKRLEGFTGVIEKNDMNYLKNYIKKKIMFDDYYGDPDYPVDSDDDYAADEFATLDAKMVDDFCETSLSDVVQEINKRKPTMFGIHNENVKKILNIYLNSIYSDRIYFLFSYLVWNKEKDYYLIQDWMENI